MIEASIGAIDFVSQLPTGEADFTQVDEVINRAEKIYRDIYGQTSGHVIEGILQPMVEDGSVSEGDLTQYRQRISDAVDAILGNISEPLSQIWVKRKQGQNLEVENELIEQLQVRHEPTINTLKDPLRVLTVVQNGLDDKISKSEGYEAMSGDANYRDTNHRRLREINDQVISTITQQTLGQ